MRESRTEGQSVLCAYGTVNVANAVLSGMSPTRRTFLRAGSLATVALVAGCTAGGPGDDGPTTDEPTDEPTDDGLPGDDGTDDPTGGTRPEGTGGPGLTLVGSDDAPDLPVTPRVEVTEDVATAEHPPQLRVTVTNDSDEPVQVGEGRDVVFSYVTSESGQLTLLPAEGDYPAEPDCWRLTEGIAVTREYRILSLEPGESVSQLVDVYGAPNGDGCLPVGEHRFEAAYTVMSGDGSAEEQARWGFSVLLE